MTLPDSIIEEAKRRQKEEDEASLDKDSKIGEGANNSAHVSSRGYVIKPVSYDLNSETPFEQAKKVQNIDRFPWIEIDQREVDGPFQYAMTKIERSDLTHEETVEMAHIDDVIEEDIEMFLELRESNITYGDLKPENIGYFLENNQMKAKPIDVIDQHAWEQEENLLYRRFSDILDVYIRGTPNEEGLTDKYSVSVPYAEKVIMDYLDLDAKTITGDPYKDFFQILNEDSQETLEEVIDY